MLPTFLCTWAPCRRLFSSRCGDSDIFLSVYTLSHDFTFLFHSVCVSWFQIQHLGADLHPGDVLLSNHPSAGGSHLPDLTVITPVGEEYYLVYYQKGRDF